jgi:hypothetical protein
MLTNSAAVGAIPEETNDLGPERMELGLSLGLREPVSMEVLQAALRDETYAHNLRVSCRSPAVLKMLLAKPLKLAPASRPFSTGELAVKAAEALGRWAKTGFSVVDQPTLERRKEACYSCPNLSTANQAVYKFALGSGSICSVCGCKVDSKMRLPSESCPDRHPERAGLTRWGEPLTRSFLRF